MLNDAGHKFVPLCKGISGTIGSLDIDKNYMGEPTKLPIDTLVLNLMKVEGNDIEMDSDGEIAVEVI